MAITVDVRTVDGSVSGSVTLDDAFFGVEPNVAVMHQVVTAQLAAARAGTHSTKTRAQVSGGGKKPFRQKGTGRARQGPTRAPHWTGGGVAFGPHPRTYRQRTPRKMISLALRSALSDRAAEDRVMVVAEWPWTEPRTARARDAVAALGLDGRVLVVLDREVDEHADRSFRNLPLVQVILTGELNAYDVLCNDWIVFTRTTLPGATVYGAPAEPSPDAEPVADAEETADASAIEPVAAEDAGGAEPSASAAAEPAATTAEPAAIEPVAAEPADDVEPAAEPVEPAAAEPSAAAAADEQPDTSREESQ